MLHISFTLNQEELFKRITAKSFAQKEEDLVLILHFLPQQQFKKSHMKSMVSKQLISYIVMVELQTVVIKLFAKKEEKNA